MTLADYDALLIGWQEIHAKDGAPVAAPDPEKWQRNRERLRNSPLARSEPAVIPGKKGNFANGKRRNGPGHRRTGSEDRPV